MKEGWTPVSESFLRLYGGMHPPISAGEAMFIIQLLSFKWDRSMPRPGLRTLAQRMGVSDTQVRSYARSLEKNGYLKRILRVGQTNRFDLGPLFAALGDELQGNPVRKPEEDFD